MHEVEFGVTARWSYLESGHGKGPCDGLGASVKRGADNAVKQGKISIQCAEDFLKWTEQAVKSGSKVTYIPYKQSDYDESEVLLSERTTPLPVKGTFKLHYVVGAGNNKIYSREVTCYNCSDCRQDISKTGCEGYSVHQLAKNEESDITVDQLQIELEQADTQVQAVGSWIAAIYMGKWYIGQIQEIDKEDGELFLRFMTASGKYGNCFKWPKDNDELWVKPSYVLYVLPKAPQASGKTGRMFRAEDAEIKLIEERVQKSQIEL